MFFDAAPCPCWILNERTRRIVDVNRAAVEQYGYTRDEFLRMRLDELAPARERARQLTLWKRASCGRVDGRCRHVTKSGRPLAVHVLLSRLESRTARRGSQVACLAWSCAEASDDEAPIGLLHLDRQGRVTSANVEATKLLRRAQTALRGLRLEDLATPDARPTAREVVETLARRRPWTGTLSLRRPRSHAFDAELRAAGRLSRDAHVVAFYDVSDRTKADAALRRAGERYRRLSDHDRTVREEERARIARELHDQLGQSLSAFKMDLAWLSALTERAEPTTARAAIAGMMERVDTAISIVRRIAGDLRPGVLDRLGLVAAIEWQAAEFERRSGARCQVTCQGECPPFDRAQSTEIFRIVQETLANVSRHAGATSVRLAMTCAGDRVVLRISDNGRGIPQAAIDSDQSLGLVGMRERATILGGTLTVSRGVSRGTDALLVVPNVPNMVGPSVGARTTER